MIKDGMIYEDTFNGQCYLDQNPDVAMDGKYNDPVKAYTHYWNYGQYEGRPGGCLIGPAPIGTPDDPTTDPPEPTTSNKTVYIIVAIAAVILLFGKKLFK